MLSMQDGKKSAEMVCIKVAGGFFHKALLIITPQNQNLIHVEQEINFECQIKTSWQKS